MRYFSYGSNMSSRRILSRVDAVRLGTAMLTRHQLRFHKVSNKDGTGKCDIHETGAEDHVVFGVLYEIADEDVPVLDKIEGVGYGYQTKFVAVEFNGDPIEAYSYYATKINPALKPLHWYKQHVLAGAVENKLPEDYIQEIESVESIEDSNVERHVMELSIYQADID